MNVLILGCGKTGSRLAQSLDHFGFDVAILDEDKNSFELLSSDFSGLAVVGKPIDVEDLRNAGAENADLAVVVTESDNTNIMAAQTLEVEFGIKDVYVRLLDPSRETVFRNFGLKTVCATRLESDVLLSIITDKVDEIDTVRMAGFSVRFEMEKVDKRDIGKKLPEIKCKNGEMAFGVKKRDGSVHLANEESLILEEGDKIICAKI